MKRQINYRGKCFMTRYKSSMKVLQFNNDLVILVGLSLWETEQVRGRDESY